VKQRFFGFLFFLLLAVNQLFAQQFSPDYHLAQIDKLEKSGDKRGQILHLTELATHYWDKKEQVKAVQFFEKIVQINTELGNHAGAATALNFIGIIYTEQKEHAKALSQYEKALEARKKVGASKGLAEAHLNLGVAFMDLKNYQAAIAPLKEAAQIAENKLLNNILTDAYENLADSYEKLGDKENALLYNKKFNQAYTKEADKIVADLQANKKPDANKHEHHINNDLHKITSDKNELLLENEQKIRRLLEENNKIDSLFKSQGEQMKILNRENELLDALYEQQQEELEKER